MPLRGSARQLDQGKKMNELQLPMGTMRTSGDGTLIVRLRARRDERKTARAWFDRLRALNLSWMLLPEVITEVMESPGGIDLKYGEESKEAVSLTKKIEEWGRDLPASLPMILTLGRFMITIAEEFAQAKEAVPPLGPAQIKFLPGPATLWRMLPMPTAGLALADWARSGADAWLWSSSGSLLGGLQHDAVHALGAALHQGLTGTLFPETLSERERFARLLRGRVGLAQRLEAAVTSALPRACAAEAIKLCGLILDCLYRQVDLRPTEADARKRFKELEQKLSLDRLMQSWEYENRPEIVKKMMELAFVPPVRPKPPPPPPPSVPGTPAPTPEALPTGKDWSDVARDYLAQGNLNNALDAAWNAVFNEGPVFIRLYLGVLQVLAARSPLGLAQVSAALARLEQTFRPQFSESDNLQVIHLKTRYLQVPEAELGQVDRPCESRWNEGISLLLQARMQLCKGDQYSRVSKLCQEGRKRFEAMPRGGGDVGSYAQSYLYLLDGIAHIKYVGVSKQVDYFADSLEKFGKSFELAAKSGVSPDLVSANLRWLARLAQLTRTDVPRPPLSLVFAGTEAILRSQGVQVDLSSQDTPEIPWYNDAVLFPL